MVNLGGVYDLAASEIIAVKVYETEDPEYKYAVTAVLRGQILYTVRYKTKGEQQNERHRVIAQVGRELNRMDTIEERLYYIEMALKRLDKRQLKIWRLVKQICGLKGDDDGTS